MPLLHDPTQFLDTFSLTPDYDAVLADWVNLHPDQPDGPYFTTAECRPFDFRWPVTPGRAANGRFVKNGG